jgi:hypothetical protein
MDLGVSVELGAWCLGLFWMLDVGIWMLFRPHDLRHPRLDRPRLDPTDLCRSRRADE